MDDEKKKMGLGRIMEDLVKQKKKKNISWPLSESLHAIHNEQH